MTYEESYRTFTDVESLMKEVARDVQIALFFGGGNQDRIKSIKRACENVVNEKFPDFKEYSVAFADL